MMHFTILAQIFCCRTTQIIQDDCLSTKKASPCYTCLKRVSCCLFLFPPHLIHGKKNSPTNLNKGFSPFRSCPKEHSFLGGLPLFLTPNSVERWHKIRGESSASVKQPETGMQFQTELSNFFLIKIINYWAAISNSKGVSQGPFIEVYEL